MLIFMTFFANGPSDDETEQQMQNAECRVQNEEDEGTQEIKPVGDGGLNGPSEPQSEIEDAISKATDNDN